MTSIDTIYESYVAPLIYLRLRKTTVHVYPYAINLHMGTYSTNSYYFKSLEEAKTFYDLKLIELRQVLKFTEGGNHGSSES